MLIVKSFEEIPDGVTATVMTLGNFDGLHLGHVTLINHVVTRARAADVPSVLLTFQPHPLKVLHPEKPLQRIKDFDETVNRLEIFGLDILMTLVFTRDLATLKPHEFLNNYVRKFLNPRTIVLGYNHRFGADRKGDIETIRTFGKQYGIDVVVVEPILINGDIVSSTRIRELIVQGDMTGAKLMLGAPFRLSGIVKRGQGRGAGLGFPTANLKFSDRILPPSGVYATIAHTGETTSPSISYVGSSPTFGGTQIQVETHLFGHQENLYGHHLKVDFIEKIRDEITFESTFNLVKKMRQDARKALKIYRGYTQENPEEDKS